MAGWPAKVPDLTPLGTFGGRNYAGIVVSERTMTSNELFQQRVVDDRAIYSDGENGQVWQSGDGEDRRPPGGLPGDGQGVPASRPDRRVPNRNYLSEKKNVANFPKILGEGATFPRSAVTLPNSPWPQLHGFKAPERLLHFSDRSQKKLDETDQISAAPTSVTVEQILAGIDVEGRAAFPM